MAPPHAAEATRSSEGPQAAVVGPTELLIRDRVYDVAQFVKKHPGGSIIRYQLGTDATDAFTAFHDRSGKVDKFLKSLPSRPVKSDPEAALADFRTLREQLRQEGFFEPSPAHIAYRLGELVAMHALGLGLVYAGFTLAGLTVLGIAQGRCGWLMHEAGHYSLTTNITVDRHLQMLTYGLGCGMSAAFWRNQHNKHHATPQKLQHDVDLDTLPLLAFNEIIARKGSKRWLQFQAILFAPVITTLVALGWQLYLHPRHSIRSGNFLEIVYMVLRYACWFWAFGHYGLWTALGMYLVYVAIGGAYIFANFAVSHTHKDVLPEDQHANFVLYASNHTCNCTPSWWCNWWMSFLNFQIEHHLFPSMPQYRHPEVSKRVRELFKKHGLTYDCRSYWECLRVTFANLHKVGNSRAKAA